MELETVDGRGDGLTSSRAAVGVADGANDEVGFGEEDCSLSGRLELVSVSGSGSTLFKGSPSCT